MKDKAIWVAIATATTTVLLSMVLNSWAFTQLLDTWFGHVLGVLLPLWILALTFMGHRLWTTGDRRLASAAFGLAGFALLVSMPHLANGYARLGLSWWECWSLALVTDLTQVVSKLLVIECVQRHEQRTTTAQQTNKRIRRTQPKLAA